MVPPARVDTVEVFWDDFLPLARMQIVQVDLTVNRSVGAVNETTSVARSPIDDEVVLVRHHEMVGSVRLRVEFVLHCVLVVC